MKNVILSLGVLVFAVPLLAGAQISIPSAQTSCPIPVNLTAASDWTTTITCLINRISDIENRLLKLEKGGGESITKPVVPSGEVITSPRDLCKQTSYDTWVCTRKDQAEKTEVTTEGVRAIQTFLKADGSFAYPTPTGYYGTYTKEAVYRFQEKNNLVSSGIIDQPTLQKMEMLAPQIAPSVQLEIQKLTP